MNRPRLLLADDHPGTRAVLRSLLEPDFDLVAEVADGLELVSAANRLLPDVIVTDISMPQLDGIAAATQIHRGTPEVPIVLITMHGDAMLRVRGMAAGALGFISKLVAGTELVPAVHAALRGECTVTCVGDGEAGA